MQADRQCLFGIARMDVERKYSSRYLVFSYKHGRGMIASVRRNETIHIAFQNDRFQAIVVLHSLIAVQMFILVHILQFDVET